MSGCCFFSKCLLDDAPCVNGDQHCVNFVSPDTCETVEELRKDLSELKTKIRSTSEIINQSKPGDNPDYPELLKTLGYVLSVLSH